jgi:hypothetical protein
MVDANVLEDGGLRGPLAGMFPPDLPQTSLETALTFCTAYVPAVTSSIRIALKKAKKLEKLYPLLSVDERAAVVLYTIEVFPQTESVRRAHNCVYTLNCIFLLIIFDGI